MTKAFFGSILHTMFRAEKKIVSRSVTALAGSMLFACAEPTPIREVTPQAQGAYDGRLFADEYGTCPEPWRDETGAINTEQMSRAFFAGLYDSDETLELLDRYRNAFDAACETQLIRPRSDV